jgi:hypothetical protein
MSLIITQYINNEHIKNVINPEDLKKIIKLLNKCDNNNYVNNNYIKLSLDEAETINVYKNEIEHQKANDKAQDLENILIADSKIYESEQKIKEYCNKIQKCLCSKL